MENFKAGDFAKFDCTDGRSPGFLVKILSKDRVDNMMYDAWKVKYKGREYGYIMEKHLTKMTDEEAMLMMFEEQYESR